MTDFCGNSIPDPARKPGEETRCECLTRVSVLFRRRSDARILQKCGTPHHLPRILVEASQIPPLLRFGHEARHFFRGNRALFRLSATVFRL